MVIAAWEEACLQRGRGRLPRCPGPTAEGPRRGARTVSATAVAVGRAACRGGWGAPPRLHREGQRRRGAWGRPGSPGGQDFGEGRRYQTISKINLNSNMKRSTKLENPPDTQKKDRPVVWLSIDFLTKTRE